MSDDYTGVTHYASELTRDFWGAYAKRPLKRNLQEIASPLNDPLPVNPYRGPDYEYVDPSITTVAPQYVGTTSVPTNRNNAAIQGGVVT